MAGFFTYLANSSFVMIDHYGLSPTLYSLAFGVNAAAFFGAAQFNGTLCERFGIVRVVQGQRGACGLVMLAMFGYYLGGGDRLAVLIVLYFIASGFMGFVIPTTSVLALEEARRHRGHRLGAAGHAADADRRGGDGGGRPVHRRPAAADGGRHGRRRADRAAC